LGTKVAELTKKCAQLEKDKHRLERTVYELRQIEQDKDQQIEVLLRRELEQSEELEKWTQANHSLREEMRRIMDRSTYIVDLHSFPMKWVTIVR
jgi:cation transport regulator ChaC